jgi:hypothetical protein
LIEYGVYRQTDIKINYIMIIRQSFTIEGAEGRLILMDLHFKNGQEDHPIVLFVHGFKGFKDWGAYNLVAEYFVKQGFRFLKFNFSHNGTNPESPTEFTDRGAFGLPCNQHLRAVVCQGQGAFQTPCGCTCCASIACRCGLRTSSGLGSHRDKRNERGQQSSGKVNRNLKP